MMLFLLCGLPGSGKTTFAKKLQKQTNAIVFNIDKEVIEKYGILTSQKEHDKAEFEIKKLIYERCKKLLVDNKNIILDFGFWKKDDRKKYIDLAYRQNSKAIIYYFKKDLSVLRKNIEKRNKILDKNTYHITDEMLEKFSLQFEKPTDDEGDIILV